MMADAVAIIGTMVCLAILLIACSVYSNVLLGPCVRVRNQTIIVFTIHLCFAPPIAR